MVRNVPYPRLRSDMKRLFPAWKAMKTYVALRAGAHHYSSTPYYLNKQVTMGASPIPAVFRSATLGDYGKHSSEADLQSKEQQQQHIRPGHKFGRCGMNRPTRTNINPVRSYIYVLFSEKKTLCTRTLYS